MTAECFRIEGQVAPSVFAPWIERHARRLGIHARIMSSEPEWILVEVAGPPDLLDAMEMGCLLGPIEVWVDTICRTAAMSPQPC